MSVRSRLVDPCVFAWRTALPAFWVTEAVIDVRLPNGDGVSVCREVRSRVPRMACLMLASFSDDEALQDSIMA